VFSNTISLIKGYRLSLPLLLLLITIDSIVNTDSYNDIRIEYIRTVFLVELVLNLFLKAIVK
jgi:hypothetical protein